MNERAVLCFRRIFTVINFRNDISASYQKIKIYKSTFLFVILRSVSLMKEHGLRIFQNSTYLLTYLWS
jgi:hypothetical protein